MFKFLPVVVVTFEQMAEDLEKKIGATRRTRTGDLLITNQLLYQLS